MYFERILDVLAKRKQLKKANANKINKKIKNMEKKGKLDTDYISDGQHTFESLYYQRCVLFACICNNNKRISWKSKQHDDGTMFDNYFIVGINTKQGQYTYHYELDYWDMFNVKELEKAPKWDGHTDKDVLRLLNLK